MASSGISFASRGASTIASPTANTATVNYGTVLSPGQSASYPTSLFDTQMYRNHSNGLPAGAIAGIVVGSVAAALLVAFLIFLYVMRKRRIAKQNKRASRAQLLPTTVQNGSSGTSEMVQRQDYAGTGNLAMPVAAATGAGAGAAAAAPNSDGFTTPTRQQRKTGLMFGGFGKGHVRTDSTNSTTPFFSQNSPTSPTSPMTAYSGRTSASFDYPRPSSDAYTMPGTPTRPQ